MPAWPARRITVLQHVPFEGPGAVADWAEARGVGVDLVRLHCGEPIPERAAIDALVVMGGPMGAGDEQRFPFLRDEKRLLRECVEAGRPVLGVCLGAQLLADALGARVSAQGYREIGWFPLRWNEWARCVVVLSHVPEASTVFHWHGDTFAIPPDTIPLGSSEGCANQGFVSPDGLTLGLQFHLEMRDEDVHEIVRHGRHELAEGGRFVQGEAEILAGHVRHGAPLVPLLETLLDGWLATCDRDRLSAPTQKWLPVVDTELCDGCGACVEACGPRSLELHDGLAVLVAPETCGSEEHCIAPCHSEAIRMAWLKANGDTGVGRWR